VLEDLRNQAAAAAAREMAGRGHEHSEGAAAAVTDLGIGRRVLHEITMYTQAIERWHEAASSCGGAQVPADVPALGAFPFPRTFEEPTPALEPTAVVRVDAELVGLASANCFWVDMPMGEFEALFARELPVGLLQLLAEAGVGAPAKDAERTAFEDLLGSPVGFGAMVLSEQASGADTELKSARAAIPAAHAKPAVCAAGLSCTGGRVARASLALPAFSEDVHAPAPSPQEVVVMGKMVTVVVLLDAELVGLAAAGLRCVEMAAAQFEAGFGRARCWSPRPGWARRRLARRASGPRLSTSSAASRTWKPPGATSWPSWRRSAAQMP